MKVNELLDTARAEIGYIGKRSNMDLDIPEANPIGNYTKYARDLFEAQYFNGNKQGFAWCATFNVCCGLVACGMNKELAEKIFPVGSLSAGVKYHKMYYASQGRVGSEPKPGACIYFKDSTGELCHVGWVEKVEGDTVYTIEGNASQKVQRKSYNINYNRIDSYGYPFYEEEPEPTEDWETVAEWKDNDGKELRLQKHK